MTINQGVQLKRVIKGRKLRETTVRESVKLAAQTLREWNFNFFKNKLKKKKLDGCLQGLFKFHIHISRQIWYTFMVSKRNTLFHVLLCYAFFIANAISNPTSVFRIHIGLQRFLEFTRLGNTFAVQELLMSPDSFGSLLAKRDFLISRIFFFSFFFF